MAAFQERMLPGEELSARAGPAERERPCRLVSFEKPSPPAAAGERQHAGRIDRIAGMGGMHAATSTNIGDDAQLLLAASHCM